MIDWAAWAPTGVAVVAVAFNHGQLVGRIKNQETALAEHHVRLDLHDTKLESHAIAIAKLESWKEGYNAGVARAGAK